MAWFSGASWEQQGGCQRWRYVSASRMGEQKSSFLDNKKDRSTKSLGKRALPDVSDLGSDSIENMCWSCLERRRLKMTKEKGWW